MPNSIWTQRTRIDPNATYDGAFAYDSEPAYDASRLGSDWDKRTQPNAPNWSTRTRIDVRV